MTTRHANLLDPGDTALLIIDVQEKFRSAMSGFEAMVAGCCRLARTFRTLELPILLTEQYPKGLGSTVSELAEALGTFSAPEKTAFSSYRCEGIAEKLRELGTSSVLVCGIEAHVCVNQTVHDLLDEDYAVHVAADAVQSRKGEDRDIALRKMDFSGAILTTTEMAAFELLADAKHERFREVQAYFK